MKEELIYLVFVVSKQGLKMDPEKVQAIWNWPIPRNIFEVRIFHGLVSFIGNLSEVLVRFVHQFLKQLRRSISHSSGQKKQIEILNC